MRLACHLINLLVYAALVSAKFCPSIQKPCVCSSTNHEAIVITCNMAASIDVVMRALPKSLLFIDSFTISNTPIVELPPYVFKDYLIKRLKLRNNGMSDIHPQAFEGNLDSLEELEIRANKLKTISQNALASLRNLNTLTISEDNIPIITDYAFNTWRSKTILKKLDLNSNNLSSISKHGFTGLRVLKQLSLDKNMFYEIPTEALRTLTHLEDLSMSVNYISTVPVGSLPLPNLKSLSFEVNQISAIPAEAFQETPQTLYLYLSGNRFESIDPNMFYYINQLKVLAMSNNPKIKVLSANTFQYVPSLIRLEMSECSIAHIEDGTLQKAAKLQVITLHNNQLTHIGRTTFAHLNGVVSIDLRNNQINSIDDFAFSKLRYLRHLDISGNSLQKLQHKTFYSTYQKTNPPITRILYLYDNPWNCDENLQWMREWLRNNDDILLTAPGQRPASCRYPPHLHGLDLRQTDPYTTLSQTVPQVTRIYIESAKKTITPKTINNFGNQQYWQNSNNHYTIPYHKRYTKTTFPPPPPQNVQMSKSEASMSQAAIVALVLGAIMSLCIISVVLVVAVRCAIRWKAKRRRNEDFQEVGRSSAFSGFASRYGSGIYPRNYFQKNYQNQQQSVHYLNRPWNWWS